MKILIVADRFFPSEPGGLARVAWDVAEALADRGHMVDFVAAESGPEKFEAITTVVGGVTVHRFWRPRFPAWHPHRLSVPISLYTEAVRNVVRETRFDAIHFHSIFTGMAVKRAVRQMPVRPRIVYTVHSPVAQEQHLTWSQQGLLGVVNDLIGTPIVRRMEGNLISFADETHVLSQFTARELRKEHPRLPGNYRVIPHFVYDGWVRAMPREEARRQLQWPRDIPCLFTVRQLRYRYGLDTAIEAVAPMASTGRCHLYIAGEGPDRAKLQKLIDSLGCQPTIKLMGRIDDETLRCAYQGADLFVLPTRHLECFGLISLEAMSYGLPVLGTNVGAIPEVTGPILPEFVIPPGDPVALRNKIDLFLEGRMNTPSETNISAHVRANYAAGRVIGEYEAMYSGGRKREPSPRAGAR